MIIRIDDEGQRALILQGLEKLQWTRVQSGGKRSGEIAVLISQIEKNPPVPEAGKPTPGPWVCDGRESYAVHEEASPTGHIIALFAADYRSPEENHANARLVAGMHSALMDAVVALKAMLEAEVYADAEGVCAIASSDMDTGIKGVMLARAAIAKAEALGIHAD